MKVTFGHPTSRMPSFADMRHAMPAMRWQPRQMGWRGWLPRMDTVHFDVPGLPWAQHIPSWGSWLANWDVANLRAPTMGWPVSWWRPTPPPRPLSWWDVRSRFQALPNRRAAITWWSTEDRLIGLCAGVALGAAAMYLLDPRQGNARRKLAFNRAAGMSRRAVRGTRRLGRKLSSDISGKMQAAIHTRAAQQIVDDATLAHKVESILFRDPEIPKGSISINCEEGTVFLRGALDEAAWIPEIDRRVRAIPGVEDVRNLLHPTGTPAP